MHNLVGAASKACRSVHITGTKGEIQGILEDGAFVIRHPEVGHGQIYTEERVEISVTNDMHGGRDHLHAYGGIDPVGLGAVADCAV